MVPRPTNVRPQLLAVLVHECQVSEESLLAFLTRTVGAPSYCIPCLPASLAGLTLAGGNFAGCEFSGLEIASDISNTVFDEAYMFATR